MKKIVKFSLIFCVLLTMLLPSFLMQKNANLIENVANSANIEEIITNKQDLISANPSGILNASIEDGITPYDEQSGQKMAGASICPTSDSYGQVKSFTVSVTTFSANESSSIFMWCYFIDAITFQLKISVSDGFSNSCEWIFNAINVYSFGTGWKFIELKFSDCKTEIADISLIDFKVLNIKYYSEIEDCYADPGYEPYNVETNEKFSFYHVYIADSILTRNSSGVAYNLPATFYKFKSNFFKNERAYIGDKYTFVNDVSIFDFLIVGKYDLTNYKLLNRYYWLIEVKTPDGVNYDLDFGNKMYFSQQGYYHISLKLYEEKTLTNELILNATTDVYCDEISLGNYFSGRTYNIKQDERLLIKFNVNDDLILNDEIDMKLSNKNAEIESYYKENGVYYITLKALKEGDVKLKLSATVKTKNNEIEKDCSSSATIKIASTENKIDIFMIILWITFGIFCVVFIVKLLISVVNARKNDVK